MYNKAYNKAHNRVHNRAYNGNPHNKIYIQ